MRRILLKEGGLFGTVPSGFKSLGIDGSQLSLFGVTTSSVDTYLTNVDLIGSDLIFSSLEPGYSGTVSLSSLYSFGATGATGSQGIQGATGPSFVSSDINNQNILGTDGYIWSGSFNTTGISIGFTNSMIYNSPSSPGTSSITEDLTGAKIGIVQKIYHQWTTAPSIPANWTKLGSGVYSTSSINRIYVEWVGGTSSEYWIV